MTDSNVYFYFRNAFIPIIEDLKKCNNFFMDELDYKIKRLSMDLRSGQSQDLNLYKFVSDYFKARTNLNFPKIFSSFGRDTSLASFFERMLIFM